MVSSIGRFCYITTNIGLGFEILVVGYDVNPIISTDVWAGIADIVDIDLL